MLGKNIRGNVYILRLRRLLSLVDVPLNRVRAHIVLHLLVGGPCEIILERISAVVGHILIFCINPIKVDAVPVLVVLSYGNVVFFFSELSYHCFVFFLRTFGSYP